MSQASATASHSEATVNQKYAAKANTVSDAGLLGELGFVEDFLVQEIGFDDDVDHALREALDDQLAEELVDEEEHVVVDAVLLWFRDGDDDLTDALLDCLSNLDEGGMVWLLTPRAGRQDHVPSVEIQDAATNSGLHVTSSAGVSAHWAAAKLVSRKMTR